MKKEECLHIEIAKSIHKNNYDLRIGDILGTKSLYNISLKELMEQIKDEVVK